MRDQVLMPLVQGMAWTLIVAGWRHWNKASNFKGRTVGSRIRRWWWGVNNWTIPEAKGRMRDASKVEDFYKGQASAGSD